MSQSGQRVGVVAESRAGETRVAATPATVEQLCGLGYEVVVEAGAGSAGELPRRGVRRGRRRISSGRRGVGRRRRPAGQRARPPRRSPAARTARRWSACSPRRISPDLVEALARRPITALAMDAVPRISRAQSLDVLSARWPTSPATARSIEAAHEFGRFFTGQVTAAGKVPPAKVLVAGAGVAGLAAIGAAGSLGAIVRATDARPEVAEQVESMGGEYLAVRRPSEAAGQRRRLRQGDGRGLQPRGPPSCTPSRPPTSTSSSPPR